MAHPSAEEGSSAPLSPPAGATPRQDEPSAAEETSSATGGEGAESSTPAQVTTTESGAPAGAAETGGGGVGVDASGQATTTSPTYYSSYHAVTTGQPADPVAVQAAAIAQQHAMYSGFGAPYAAHHAPTRPQYSPGGYPAYYYPNAAGGAAAAAPLYPMKAPATLPGPCYYDPYGMLNPVACIAPMRMAPGDEHAGTKLLTAKKQSRWCC